jgi:hypothetical protein
MHDYIETSGDHSYKMHQQSGCRIKFYYLVRHIKSNGSTKYPADRQIVCHGSTEKQVEQQLERIQKTVQMPPGCTYSIEHF